MAKKDPNNAYGSKAAREKAMRDVSADIFERDMKDTKRSTDYLPYYTHKGEYDEARVGPTPSKLEAMAFVDASRRLPKQGWLIRAPMEMKKLGEKGEAEAKKLRKPTKKMAMGGSVSKRADGCATKGKTKGRFV